MTKPKQRAALKLDVHVTLSEKQMVRILAAIEQLGKVLDHE